VAFRERGQPVARLLQLNGGAIAARSDLAAVQDLAGLPARAIPPRAERQVCFDAITYDRMRVLATELGRVHGDGGEIALRFGARRYDGERLARLLRWV
jgi:hypothetical protein